MGIYSHKITWVYPGGGYGILKVNAKKDTKKAALKRYEPYTSRAVIVTVQAYPLRDNPLEVLKDKGCDAMNGPKQQARYFMAKDGRIR